MSIRFIAIRKLTADSLLVSHSNEPKYSAGFLNETSIVFTQLKSVNLSPEERQKIATANGEWFCQVNQAQVAFAVLCAKGYPERHAYGLTQEARIELEKILDQEPEMPSSQVKLLKRSLEKLAKKYSNLKELDRLAAANEKAAALKTQMGKNIVAQTMNNKQLEQTLETSHKLKDLSHEFLGNSEEMKKIQQRRLLKIQAVIGLLILGVIGVGVWLIIRDRSSD